MYNVRRKWNRLGGLGDNVLEVAVVQRDQRALAVEAEGRQLCQRGEASTCQGSVPAASGLSKTRYFFHFQFECVYGVFIGYC